MPKLWAQGMRQLTEGVYSDGRGGLHIDCVEMLQAEEFPVTPENINALETAVKEVFGILAAEIFAEDECPERKN